MELMDTAVNEAFLLDLLNSTPIVDGLQQDELETAQSGRSWLRACGLHGSIAQWQAVGAARATLQAVVRGQQRASSLTPLLDATSYRPSVSDNGVQWRLDAPTDRAAAARAVLTWDALRRTRPGRRPNTARWCSMAVCGNRMKARRHYQRTRTSSDH